MRGIKSTLGEQIGKLQILDSISYDRHLQQEIKLYFCITYYVNIIEYVEECYTYFDVLGKNVLYFKRFK